MITPIADPITFTDLLLIQTTHLLSYFVTDSFRLDKVSIDVSNSLMKVLRSSSICSESVK